MDPHDAPLIGRVLDWIDENNLHALPKFLIHFSRFLVFPTFIAIFAVTGLLSVLRSFGQIVVPIPYTKRYLRAKDLYGTGNHKEALQMWEKLEKFGPAYLSRATHALYVEHNPQQALGILRKAKEKKVRIVLKQVDMIKMDAMALQSGAGINMIDMNARFAKQEHLGVSSW